MKVICHLNEMVTPAVRYTLDFILNSSGFFFEWSQKPDSNCVHIIYSDTQIDESDKQLFIFIPCHYPLDTLHQKHLSWHEKKIGEHSVPVIAKEPSNHEIPFDLLATIYYHLTRIEEKRYTHPDQLDRNATEQQFYANNRIKIPVVDLLCHWFSDLIETRHIPLLKKAAFPSGEQCGVALTHDIDRLHAVNPIKMRFNRVMSMLGLRSKEKNVSLEKAEECLWVFDKLVSEYQKRGMKATFFFLAKKMENRSYRYAIRSRKIRRFIQFLYQNNHEIALHSSRYAFDKLGRYIKEKKKLEKILPEQKCGLRQHYIRCLFPGLWRMAATAGFLYDSSLIFRRMSGFRAGTSHPFNCFDYEHGELLPLIECPVLFFENTLPDAGADPESSISEIQELFEQVNAYQGVLVALWHQDNLYNNAPYPAIWKEFLALVDTDQLYVQTLIEQVRWHILRSRIVIKHMQQKTNRWRITLDLPGETEKFTLVLPAGSNRAFVEEKGVDYSQRGNYLCIHSVGQLSEITINIEQNS